MNNPEVRIFRNIGTMSFDLYVRQPVEGRLVLGEITMKPADPNVYHGPTLSLNDAQGQQLIDDLWSAGFRPTEGAGSAGALAATQKHLEDMRTIAFAALKPTILIEDKKGPTR